MKAKYNFILLNEAVQDLDSIFDYISNVLQSPKAALDTLEDFEKKIDMATYCPTMYPIISNELIRTELRRIVSGNYVIIFRILEDKNQLLILRILNIKQNWLNMF